MKDSLGDRMKNQYENRTRVMLPRRTWTIVRVDGKSFHTFTKGCRKPYDTRLSEAFDEAACRLCLEAQGARFGYVQSDEISIVLQDHQKIETCAWFDGNLQKIASVSASIVTAWFNKTYASPKLATFDARVFTIPDAVEVLNYFVWRQKDATRNSINSLARTFFSHKELNGLSTSQIQEKLFKEHGENWNDYTTEFKRGRGIEKTDYGWDTDTELPIFTQDFDYLRTRIEGIDDDI